MSKDIWNKGWLGSFLQYSAKGASRKAFEIWADQVPHPTKENTERPNNHILIDIRDEEFLSKDLGQENDKLFRGGFNKLIICNEFDDVWIERINRFVKRLKERINEWDFTNKGREVPRYPWWLEKTGVPEKVTLIDMLRAERWYAWQRSDGQAMARLKLIQNIVENLPQTKEIETELFDGIGNDAPEL